MTEPSSLSGRHPGPALARLRSAMVRLCVCVCVARAVEVWSVGFGLSRLLTCMQTGEEHFGTGSETWRGEARRAEARPSCFVRNGRLKPFFRGLGLGLEFFNGVGLDIHLQHDSRTHTHYCTTMEDDRETVRLWRVNRTIHELVRDRVRFSPLSSLLSLSRSLALSPFVRSC